MWLGRSGWITRDSENVVARPRIFDLCTGCRRYTRSRDEAVGRLSKLCWWEGLFSLGIRHPARETLQKACQRS